MFVTNLDDPDLGESGILLFSGGLDSTLLAQALVRRGKLITAISIDYVGRPDAEALAAKKLALEIGVQEHLTIALRYPWIAQQGADGTPTEGWFPHRNLIFFSIALHVAEIKQATFIAAGHTKSDSLTFSDASREFLDSLSNLAALSRGIADPKARTISLLAPLLDKEELFDAELSICPVLGKLLTMTWSCWRNHDSPCGSCAACLERDQFVKSISTR
jgi:7-cyano-7-deazaguanine synthase